MPLHAQISSLINPVTINRPPKGCKLQTPFDMKKDTKGEGSFSILHYPNQIINDQDAIYCCFPCKRDHSCRSINLQNKFTWKIPDSSSNLWLDGGTRISLKGPLAIHGLIWSFTVEPNHLGFLLAPPPKRHFPWYQEKKFATIATWFYTREKVVGKHLANASP